MPVTPTRMTTEELLALPDHDRHRELIRGELREKLWPTHGGPHCLTMTNLVGLIEGWVRQQPSPRGRLYTCDVPVRLRRDLDTFVGADLAYLSPEQVARTSSNAMFIDEPPTLVIEILCPADTVEEITERVQEYRAAQVALVWVVNPFDETVNVYRPGAPPELFNTAQDLTADPHRPGFRARVAEVFAG
jgi:Uma2 family endonuclease